MQIGEPVAGSSKSSGDEKQQRVAFEIRLQDMPGPDGVPLAFAPWTVFLGSKKLKAGETTEDGLIKFEVSARYKKRYLRLRAPGRRLSLRITEGAPEQLSEQEQMAHLGYNVAAAMLGMPQHLDSERGIYRRNRKGS